MAFTVTFDAPLHTQALSYQWFQQGQSMMLSRSENPAQELVYEEIVITNKG